MIYYAFNAANSSIIKILLYIKTVKLVKFPGNYKAHSGILLSKTFAKGLSRISEGMLHIYYMASNEGSSSK